MLRTVLVSLLCCLAAGAVSAQNVYLFLRASGNDIQGESRVRSLGRADSIQCYSFDLEANLPVNPATMTATGTRSYQPVKFTKPVDKSSILIWKALTRAEPVEATFKFYRPSPTGTGEEQHYLTVSLANGRIAGFHLTAPPGASGQPATEEVLITFGEITGTYTDGGIEHRDAVGVRPAHR